MALLEKRLIFDNSIITTKSTIYNLTDLKSYYNRQLANIGGIVEESIERNRKAILLFTKIMPIFNHYVCTGYGISKQYYREENDLLVGTG